MKVIIVGGVAGGASAAARLRRLDETAEIVMLERSGYISYANCGLPYYVGGEITDREALTLQTPESFFERFHVDVRVNSEAIAIDLAGKQVTVRNLADGTTYTESYDKLILSPGARPVRPPLPGIDNARIFTMRTVEDTLALRGFIDEHHPKRAVVVGGGFIGLEMTENLMQAGLAVDLVERLDQVMAPLDYDMACTLHGYLRKKGVGLHLSTAVAGFEEAPGGIRTLLEGGSALDSDLVLLAIGVSPDTRLAADAGLELGARGSIKVTDRMQTSDPDVYAVGDAVQVNSILTQQPTLLPLAGPANKQGRIAADNICGRESHFAGVQGTAVLKLFDMTAAATGLNEKAAKAAGLAYDRTITFSANHASYYPGATNMTVKVLFDPETGRLLGAQIVGFDGVDKRIDVLATAIRAGMTGLDLTELELAYAPPYGSAKDPVNMAGFVIENVLTRTVRQFHWDEVDTLPRDGSVTLLDTRTDEEVAHGRIAGTVHIPLDSLRDRVGELDPKKPVYINCHSGLRSYIACRILSQHGFTCYNLSGGWRFYDLVKRQQKLDTTPAHPCGLPINGAK